MFDVQSEASKCVIQIFSYDKGHVELVGSAVLCWAFVGGSFKRCLLTAKHVAKKTNLVTESTQSYSFNPSYNDLETDRWIMPVFHKLDWALYPLSENHYEDLIKNRRDFIPLVKWDCSGPYTFCGFPATRNKNKRGVIKSQPYSYRGSELPIKDYPSLEKNNDEYIAVHFDKDDCEYASTLQPCSFPDPHGMSGGGIFDNNGVLCGIVTEWNPQRKALIGVRTSVIPAFPSGSLQC